MRKVYMDYAATTYVKPEVLSEMLPFYGSIYGNAHSVHSYGREAAKAMELEWLIVENDDPVPNGFDDIARSLKYLKSII